MERLRTLEKTRNRIADQMVELSHSVMLEFHSTNVILDEFDRIRRQLSPILFEIERIQHEAMREPSSSQVSS